MMGTDATARFRVAVIGKGLIGSAAARHLSQQVDGVVLIGPDEPAVRAEHHDVFGSHYDEGRIYRVLDSDLIWGRLAERSIARYAEIQNQSGIPVYAEVGMLAAAASTPNNLVQRYSRTGDALGAAFDRLTSDELAGRFPYLHFGADATGAFQRQGAGHISPRRMVQAQSAAAERHGATVIHEPVHAMTSDGDGLELITASGRTVRVEQAIVATGAFANLHDVLPRKLDIHVSGRTIVLAEVTGGLLEQLRSMPSVIGGGLAPLDDFYLLPPIEYPDGRSYVKIGTGEFDHPLVTLDDFVAWFQHTGADKDREALHQMLLRLMPELAEAPVHTDTCAVTSTASGYPYVDLITDGKVCLTVGGNGQAAKSADEIGRLAAELLLAGSWQDDLPADAFRAHFAD